MRNGIDILLDEVFSTHYMYDTLKFLRVDDNERNKFVSEQHLRLMSVKPDYKCELVANTMLKEKNTNISPIIKTRITKQVNEILELQKSL